VFLPIEAFGVMESIAAMKELFDPSAAPRPEAPGLSPEVGGHFGRRGSALPASPEKKEGEENSSPSREASDCYQFLWAW